MSDKFFEDNPYFEAIKNIEVPTREEQFELGRRVQAGIEAADKLTRARSESRKRQLEALVEDGRRAREEMITRNLKLTVSIAAKFLHNGFSLEDLVEEGNIALMRAVDTYKPEMGYTFSTYASRVIKTNFINVLRSGNDNVRLPVFLGGEIHNLKKVEDQLFNTLHRTPTYRELSDATGYPVEKIARLKNASTKSVSINAAEDNGIDISATVANDTQPSDDDVSDALIEMLRTLPEDHAVVISRIFGLANGTPEYRKTVGADMGLSHRRMATIEAEAMAMMKHPSRVELLRDLAS